MASAGKVSPITRGNWSGSESYTRLDIVSSGGSSYIAKKDSVNVPVSNTEYWQLMAQGGISSADRVSYDNTASGLTADNVQGAIDEVVDKVEDVQGVTLTGTLTAGETSLELSDESITLNSTIDPYTSDYKVVATDIRVEVGKITLTFDAQSENVDVKVVIK